jgi:hypothetical protein
MQIELIGCTSAGKSTLTKNILQVNHKHSLDIVTSYDFVLGQIRLNWIKNHTIRMLVLNLFALFACLLTWRKNLEFYRFVTGAILRLPATVTWFEKLKIARVVARNVGIYEVVCRYGSDRQIVLADEGTLHIAHYLFVHVSVEPKMSDLETFIRLTPLPDVAVYVKQPESVLITRTEARKHKRIPEGGSDVVGRFIKRAVATFEMLVKSPILESRLLAVNGEECITAALDYQYNPQLAIASKIIRGGLEPIRGETPTAITLEPGR